MTESDDWIQCEIVRIVFMKLRLLQPSARAETRFSGRNLLHPRQSSQRIDIAFDEPEKFMEGWKVYVAQSLCCKVHFRRFTLEGLELPT